MVAMAPQPSALDCARPGEDQDRALLSANGRTGAQERQFERSAKA